MPDDEAPTERYELVTNPDRSRTLHADGEPVAAVHPGVRDRDPETGAVSGWRRLPTVDRAAAIDPAAPDVGTTGPVGGVGTYRIETPPTPEPPGKQNIDWAGSDEPSEPAQTT